MCSVTPHNARFALTSVCVCAHRSYCSVSQRVEKKAPKKGGKSGGKKKGKGKKRRGGKRGGKKRGGKSRGMKKKGGKRVCSRTLPPTHRFIRIRAQQRCCLCVCCVVLC